MLNNLIRKKQTKNKAKTKGSESGWLGYHGMGEPALCKTGSVHEILPTVGLLRDLYKMACKKALLKCLSYRN